MQPGTNHIVLSTRDAVAALLNDTHAVLTWPVRLALAEAFNYLDDALPVLAPPTLPFADGAEGTHGVDVGARIEALRADLLRLIDDLPDGVDPYVVGHAAGELGTAMRELTTGRPA